MWLRVEKRAKIKIFKRPVLTVLIQSEAGYSYAMNGIGKDGKQEIG